MIKIMKYGQLPPSEIFARQADTGDISAAVADILANVRTSGDEALFAYTQKFDKAELSQLEVTEAEVNEAFASVDPNFL